MYIINKAYLDPICSSIRYSPSYNNLIVMEEFIMRACKICSIEEFYSFYDIQRLKWSKVRMYTHTRTHTRTYIYT